MAERSYPTLSLCMIVKDEEEFLPKCLESVKDVVDEMVVVDTGSTDRTVEIARAYGAKVYHHPWQDSFSEARNYGLQFATGDWILQLDADEELAREDAPILKEILRAVDKVPEVNAIFVAIHNIFKGGVAKHYFQRIFRRGHGHYEGIVHNQLVYDGYAATSEIKVYHYGYDLSPDRMERKFIRTSGLLHRHLKEHPEDTFSWSNLVRVYRSWKKFDKAVEIGENVIARLREKMSPSHWQMIAYDTAYSHMMLGDLKRAEELCKEVLEDFPNNLDVLFTLAAVRMKQEKYQEAIETFREFLRARKEEYCRPKFSYLVVDSYGFEDRAWFNIGEAYRLMGQLAYAEEPYLLAIRHNPKMGLYYRNLAALYGHLGRTNDQISTLRRAREEGIEERWVFWELGFAYWKKGDLQKAEETYREGLSRNPDDPDMANALAQVLLDRGRIEEAGELLRRVLEGHRDHIGLLTTLGLLRAQSGDRKGVIEVVERVEALNPPQGVYKDLGKLCKAVGAWERAAELLERYLPGQPQDVEALSELAWCYAQMGRYRAALEGYKAAMNIDPRHPGIREGIRDLSRMVRESS